VKGKFRSTILSGLLLWMAILSASGIVRAEPSNQKELMPGVEAKAEAEACPIYAPFSTIVNPSPDQGFFWGFQMIGGTNSFYPWLKADLETRLAQAARDIRGAGAGWTRAYLIWADVEPKVKKENFSRYLGKKDYPTREQVTDQMIEDYAFNQGAWSGENVLAWNRYDCLVKNMTDNGVGIFLNLGLEDDWAMPVEAESGKKLDPGLTGQDQYLGLLYLHCRAAVRRYGPRVQYYQLEDELNAGYLRGVVFYKVRQGWIWRSEEFKGKLLQTMSDAVLEEGNRLNLRMYRMIFLHTFLSDPILRTYKHYAVKWAKYYDLLGLDIYPNSYTIGLIPETSASISFQINRAVKTLERAGYQVGKDKFVYVSETSYPTQPWQRGYNEKNQAVAIRAAIAGKKHFGKGILGTKASGFCWGALTGTERASTHWLKPGYTDSFMGIVKPDCGAGTRGADTSALAKAGADELVCAQIRYPAAYQALKQAIENSGRAPQRYPSSPK